jgi:hypothetical protein
MFWTSEFGKGVISVVPPGRFRSWLWPLRELLKLTHLKTFLAVVGALLSPQLLHQRPLHLSAMLRLEFLTA